MDEEKIYDVAKVYEDNAKRNDVINKRLTTIAIVAIICFAITVISMWGFYFITPYQYPTAEQQIEGENISQSIGGEIE
jgi:cell division protein FtsL